MSEKVAQDVASRLADAALRLSSWAKRLPEGVARSQRGLFGQVDEVVRYLESAVQEIVDEGDGSGLEVPAGVWTDERSPRRSRAELDDPLEGIRGHSRAFSIPELMSFIAVSHKTGILRVHTDEENFLVQVENGMVVYARSDHLEKGEHLAEILVTTGVVSEEVIRGFERTGPLLPESLARYLKESGFATEEDVHEALNQQVYSIFRRFSSSRDAYFRFYEGARVRTAPEVQLNINRLLIEAMRSCDEELHRENSKPSEDPVPLDPQDFQDFLLGDAAHDASVLEPEEPPFRAALEEALEGDRFEVPLLDSAASELLVLCWDEQVDVETLEQHISRDQGLCAHILRVANSAAFAPVVPVASVQLAIARLGMDRIREIALAMTVRQRAFAVPGWEDEVRSLWRRAAITSGYAKALSRRVGSTPQRGSLMGLLQDVGKPVVLAALCAVEAERGVELAAQEAQGLMQEFHGRVGALLAREWSLPTWLADVLEHHHAYDGVDEHRADVLVAHGADLLAQWAEDRDASKIEALTAFTAFSELGLTPEQVGNVLEETDGILAYAEIYA